MWFVSSSTFVRDIEYFIFLKIKNEKLLVQRQGIKLWTVHHKENRGRSLVGGTQPVLSTHQKIFYEY